jgi:ABC-2 type transport system ATP-binding protein
MTLAIDARALSKSLPTGFLGRLTPLIRDVTLGVRPGTIHGLVGANGAGKSTTLRILVGAARPTSGDAAIFGVPVTDRRARAGLGYAPDIVAIPAQLTARQFLRLHRELGSGSTAGEEVALLEEVGLAERADETVAKFSKGMQQRLSLAAALAGKPKLLVLDEPMSGLDPPGRELVRDIIRRRHQDGATILFSSHVLPDVAELCDEVTVLARGRTAFDGTMSDLVGPARGYRVEFNGARADVEAAWAGPGRCRVGGSRLIVEVDDHEALVAVLGHGRARQLTLHSVETVRARLEERIREVAAVRDGDSP